MPDIAIDSRVPDPQAVVAPRLLTVLSGYAARDDVVLTLDVGVAGAAMSVPVTVELGDAHMRTPASVPIALKATRRSGLFPAFRGAICSEDGGPLESVLRLDGTYDVPLGTLGGMVNRTVLRHAAKRSLAAFLDRLRVDVITEIQRAELAVRWHEGRHS